MIASWPVTVSEPSSARRAALARTPAPPGRSRIAPNVPGELEHASGEADEFDAALVAGAGGRTAATIDGGPPTTSADATEDERAVEDALEADPEPRRARSTTTSSSTTRPDDGPEDGTPRTRARREAVAAAPRRGRADAAETGRRIAPRPSAARPARFIAFLRASWAELQRVQWPDRRQVAQATAVVLGFVVVAGLYLGVADRVAQELVDLII